MKKGETVKTAYGEIETVLSANDAQVITYQSAARNEWYHPSKVYTTQEKNDVAKR